MASGVRLRAAFAYHGKRRGIRSVPHFEAWVERLERRVALSTINWSGNGDGTSFSQAANWVGNAVPGSGDDAVIGVGGNPTIQLPTAGLTVHSLTVTNDTLALSGGTLVTTTGVTLNGATFNFSGGTVIGPVSLTNATLDLAAGAGAASFVVNPGSTTLSGPIAANQSLLVVGAGGLSPVSADLTLAAGATNAGTITLQPTKTNEGGGPGVTLTVVPGATFINTVTGTIQAEPGGGITSEISGNFDNQGQVDVANAALLDVTSSTGQTTFTQEVSGALNVAPAATFRCSGGLFLVKGGAVSGNVQADGCSLQLASTITSPTTIHVPDGDTTLVSNDAATATVAVEGGSLGGQYAFSAANLTIAAGAKNAGTILLQPFNTNYTGGPGSTVTMAPGFTLVNSGTIQANPGMGLVSAWTGGLDNQGTISVAAGATLDFTNTTGMTLTQEPAGMMTVAPSGTLSCNGGLFLVEGGTVSGLVNAAGCSLQLASTITAPTTIYVPDGDTTLVSNDAAGATVAVEGGSVSASYASTANLTIAAGANNAGTILLQPFNGSYTGGPGSTLTMAPGFALVNTGTIQLNPGGDPNSLIVGSLINQGTVNIGVVALTIQGNYTQGPGGTLDLAIGGTPTADFGRMMVSGSVTLDGTLNESLIDGFAPAVNDSFTIISYASALGSFATFNGVALPNGLLFQETQNPANIVLSVFQAPLADLAIAMSEAPGSLVIGDQLTYTLTVTNNGPAAALDVVATDGLPTGATYVTATTSQGTVSVSGGALTAKLGGMAAGTAATITVVAVAARAGKLTNLASVTGAVVDTDPVNNTAGISVNVAPIYADVAVAMTGGPNPVIVGNNITYTITVTNDGPNTATGVVLTDPLPAGVTYVSGTASAGTITQSGASLTADLGDLGAGGAATIVLVAQATEIGAPSNTATVSSTSTDLNLANNSAMLATSVVPDQADLAVAITAPSGVVAVGGSVIYTVTVTNNGPAPAAGVVLTDALPAGETYVSATTSQGTASVSGGTVTADLGNLGVGASATVTIVATASTSGMADNTVSVTSATTSVGAPVQTASLALAVTAPPIDSPQSVVAVQDTSLPLVLGASQSDGDRLTYSIDALPGHGTLSGTAPDLTYTPTQGYSGPDSFRFSTSDGPIAGNIATVTIAVDVPPGDAFQSLVTATDTALPITLGAIEPDDHALTYTIDAGPAHGTLSGTAPDLTYTPAAGYYGSDTFSFHATDGPIAGNVATVAIAVKDPPADVPQALTIPVGASTPIALETSEPDGNALAYTVVTQPAHGTLSGTAPFLVYTPTAGYFGSDRFTFSASDGPIAGNTATVTITLDAPPVDASQSDMTTIGVTLPLALAASAPDGNPPTVTIVQPPTHGTLTGTAPDVTYTPDPGYSGHDIFLFQSSNGPATGNTAAVSILVAAPPVNADQSLTAAAGATLPITLAASEPDGDTPAYAIVTPPAHGTLSGTAPVLTYTPAPGYSGSDSFTFTSSDGPAAGNTATIAIDIQAAPVDPSQSVITAKVLPVDTGPAPTTAASSATLPDAVMSAPAPVTITSVSMQKEPSHKHKMSTAIVVQFSGPLDAVDAGNRAAYSLSTVPHGRKHTSTPVALALASYDFAANSVTLTPRKPLSLRLPLLLNVDTSAIVDASGAPIAGNNGERGSAFEAMLSRGGVSLSAAAVDRLLAHGRYHS
jgi:uncharacterized repeat protein (TIGR01451 family)